MNIIKINTEYIKLDQLLKFASIVQTGGEAKEIIKDEKVYLNDEICTQRGKKIRKGDVVKVFDQVYKIEEQ